MQEKIFTMLLQENEVTWQTILYDLVRSEDMDPWDIDITDLTAKYVAMVKRLKTLDFRITGKVVLAATILLKIKSKKFIEGDIVDFNNLMTMSEEEDVQYFDDDFVEEDIDYEAAIEEDKPIIIPRTPQPRKRKVSIFDLIEALNKALEVKERRPQNKLAEVTVTKAPEKKTDISVIIKQVYDRVENFFQTQKSLKFTQLIPSRAKEDIILTFIPLLHLSNMRKVELHQKEHFGDVDIKLTSTTPPVIEDVSTKIQA